MKTPSKTVAVVLVAASLPWFANSALAAPITAPPSSWKSAASVPVETVQWRGRGWGGVGIGLAAGAIIGGAIAATGAYGCGYGWATAMATATGMRRVTPMHRPTAMDTLPATLMHRVTPTPPPTMPVPTTAARLRRVHALRRCSSLRRWPLRRAILPRSSPLGTSLQMRRAAHSPPFSNSRAPAARLVALNLHAGCLSPFAKTCRTCPGGMRLSNVFTTDSKKFSRRGGRFIFSISFLKTLYAFLILLANRLYAVLHIFSVGR